MILSIENHCSIPQQHRMADIMEEIFGDLLFKAKRDEDAVYLPSPNQLKHRILIKVFINLSHPPPHTHTHAHASSQVHVLVIVRATRVS